MNDQVVEATPTQEVPAFEIREYIIDDKGNEVPVEK